MTEQTQSQAYDGFLVEEFKHIQTSYHNLVEEAWQLERYAILVTGATWGWCATNTKSPGFALLVWFPSVACFLFGMRAAGIHFQLKATRRCMADIEKSFNLPQSISWASEQIRQSKGIPSFVAISAYLFWLVLGFGTIIVPIYFNSHLSKTLPPNP